MLWIGGEITGMMVGVILTGGDDSALCIVYIMALLGAVGGVSIAFALANRLPPVGTPQVNS